MPNLLSPLCQERPQPPAAGRTTSTPGQRARPPVCRRGQPFVGSALPRAPRAKQGVDILRDVTAGGRPRPAPPRAPTGEPKPHGKPFWLAPSQPVRDLKRPWMQPQLWKALKQRLLSLGDDTASVATALRTADFWHPYAAWGYGGTDWLTLWGQMAASIREMAALPLEHRSWAGRILAPMGPLLGVEAGWFALQRVSLSLQRGAPPEVLLERAGQVATCFPLTRMQFSPTQTPLEDVHIKRIHLVRDVFAALMDVDGAENASAAYLLQVMDSSFESVVERVQPPLPLLAEDPADTPQRRLAAVVLAAGEGGSRMRASTLSDRIVSQADASIEDTADYIARWVLKTPS